LKPTKRQVAILAEYICEVGLPLTEKLDELFQTDFKPAFDMKWERRADEQDWDGFEDEIAKEMRAELAMGRSRAETKLLRQLRSFQLVGVGRARGRDLVIISPRRWGRLVITLGKDFVSDNQGTLRDVHIAFLGSLVIRQRAELSELFYGQSSQRVAERHGGEPGKGRPPTKRVLVEQWIEAKRVAGTLPRTQSAAMSQAVRHFRSLGGKKGISDETIRRVLVEFYSAPVAVANPHK
jgi:hypothetical protein